MDRRRLFRSWWLWAIVIIFAIFVLPSVVSGGSDYKSVNTSVAYAQIDSGNFTTATIRDKEQQLQIDLKNPVDGKKKISTSFPADASSTIYNKLTAQTGADTGRSCTTKVT